MSFCFAPYISEATEDTKLISPGRNKHIMIDLGTGNNNKMCAFLVHNQSLISVADHGR